MSLTDAAGRVPPHFNAPGSPRVVSLPGEESSPGLRDEMPSQPADEPVRKLAPKLLLIAIGGALLAGVISGGTLYYQHRAAQLVRTADIPVPAPARLGSDVDAPGIAPPASREIAALKGEPPPAAHPDVSTTAAPPERDAPPVDPSGPGATPAEPPIDSARTGTPSPTALAAANPTVPAAASPAAPPPQVIPSAGPPLPAPTAPAAASDPIAATAALQPAPMTPEQQRDVLALVTQMGIIVRDLRTENAQMRTALDQLAATLDARTNEFDQRLTLAEAKGAVAAAMGAGNPETPVPEHAKPLSLAPVSVKRAAAPPNAAGKPVEAGEPPKRYRIQAASPGLAILAALDAGPDQTRAIQVAVGDPLPGYGKITDIFQRGTSWVVKAERGSIQ
jgi:hypothetical protein